MKSILLFWKTGRKCCLASAVVARWERKFDDGKALEG